MNGADIQNELVLQDIKERIALGDEKAFRQLFDCFAPKLIQFALAIVREKDGATEVVDEVFVKIWKQKEQTPHIKNLKVYLYSAVKNTALNYLAARARAAVTEPFDFVAVQLQDEQCPEQQLITAEIFKKIRQAVEELPPRCKIIFKLVREDGLKYKEVAEILNVSINTVDAQMVIAVKRISEKVKMHFEFFAGPASQSKKKTV
jgi:RNA polymerase sigma-70 factor (family 1)